MLEPGTLKPVTAAVVPGGATTLASALPMMGVPGGVVMASGGTTSGVAAKRKADNHGVR